MKFYEYTFDAGKTYQDGKPDWPDGIRLVLPRYRALQLIGELSRQLEDYEQTWSVEVFFPGKLDEKEGE